MTLAHPSEPWRRAAAGAGLLDAAGEPQLTVFTEMSELAARSGAINLGQGFPDEDGPPEVLEAAQLAIATGQNQYPPGIGIRELREAIAAHQAHWYGLAPDPDTEVLVTAGATEAIAATILAFAGPGTGLHKVWSCTGCGSTGGSWRTRTRTSTRSPRVC